MTISGTARVKLSNGIASNDSGNELVAAIDLATPTNNIAFTGNNTHTGTEDFKRIGAFQGTALVLGDFALSAGFGASGAVAVSSGSTDTRFQITITTGGAGQAANPTCTLTYKDLGFTNNPFAVVCRGGGNQLTVPVSCTSSKTALTITFSGTPTGTETYIINGIVIG